MQLLWLHLRNFKGARDVRFEPNGQNISVFGRNFCGKTTLFDAYLWLLFGKDSENKADFDIKTTVGGKVIPNLEHTVEGLFKVKGEDLKLKRVYKEVYTKKRGSADSEFTGHTTDYFVNGVPVQKKEFDATIEDICSEQTFRMLSDVAFCPTKLPWQDLRKVLVEIAGDVSDADVIATQKSLADLPSILGSHSIDNYKRIVASRKAEINTQLDRIPVRIDELNRSLPTDNSFLSLEALIKGEEEAKAKANDLRNQLAQVSSGGAVANKMVELRQVESDIQALMTRIKQESNAGYDILNQKVRDKQAEANTIFASLKSIERERTEKQTRIAADSSKREVLRKRWQELQDLAFESNVVDSCPSCGQSLPAEKVAAAKEKALSDFNLSKAQQIEQVTREGKALKEAQETLEGELHGIDERIEAIRQDEIRVNSELSDLKSKLSSMQVATPDFSTNPEFVALTQKKSALESEIADLRQSSASETERLQSEIQAAQIEADRFAQGRNLITSAESTKKRIAELEAEQKALAAEFEKLSQHTYLIEEFIRAKVKMLTERINGHFQITSFKLFDQQVNGGLSECCEPTIDGRSYGGSLSTSERINVGLDIINTLARHYKFAPPVFIDNQESISNPLATEGQQIRLVVSPSDETLRFVTDQPQQALIA